MWKLIFTENKQEFLSEINKCFDFYNQYKCTTMKGYKLLKLYDSLTKLKLIWIYLYILRPTIKYGFILPYRKIKMIYERKNDIQKNI